MRLVEVANEIGAAVRVLARHRIGTIVLWDPVGVVEGGVLLDARVTNEVLLAIALPEYLNRIHRGAVVVRGDRVERAGAPISWAEVIERATEFAAGVAIAVDEDAGEIRIADRAGRVAVVEIDELTRLLRTMANRAPRIDGRDP